MRGKSSRALSPLTALSFGKPSAFDDRKLPKMTCTVACSWDEGIGQSNINPDENPTANKDKS